jgi:hypothetical protein
LTPREALRQLEPITAADSFSEMLDAQFGRYECNQLIGKEQTTKILMVLTSHDQLGNTGRPTGFWLEEFAVPYFVFRDAGVGLTLISPKGGQPPIDPKSDLPENQTPAMARYRNPTTR